MPESYTCAGCERTFLKTWSDAEARAEAEDIFAGETADMVMVCDDCFKSIVKRRQP